MPWQGVRSRVASRLLGMTLVLLMSIFSFTFYIQAVRAQACVPPTISCGVDCVEPAVNRGSACSGSGGRTGTLNDCGNCVVNAPRTVTRQFGIYPGISEEGFFNINGDSRLGGDLYLNSGLAIRVNRVNGATDPTRLNLGNFLAGSEFHLALHAEGTGLAELMFRQGANDRWALSVRPGDPADATTPAGGDLELRRGVTNWPRVLAIDYNTGEVTIDTAVTLAGALNVGGTVRVQGAPPATAPGFHLGAESDALILQADTVNNGVGIHTGGSFRFAVDRNNDEPPTAAAPGPGFFFGRGIGGGWQEWLRLIAGNLTVGTGFTFPAGVPAGSIITAGDVYTNALLSRLVAASADNIWLGDANDTLQVRGSGVVVGTLTVGGAAVVRQPAGCTGEQVLQWDGTAWVCATPATGPTYTAGDYVTIGADNRISATHAGTCFGPIFRANTVTTYDGTLNDGAVDRGDGYIVANTLCGAGRHICTAEEMLVSVRCSTADSPIRGMAPSTQTWVLAGPPGFTADANDCNGLTSNLIGEIGRAWIFNADGGRGDGLTCNALRSFACCG